MIFTDLTYIEVGVILGIFSLLFFSVVVVFRLVLAFRHYIHTGNFGDFEKCAFGQIIEHGNFFSVYTFTGYHPGILVMDAVAFGLVSIIIIPGWGFYIIIGLFLFLGKTMRNRIAVKQDFVAKLDGTHDE